MPTALPRWDAAWSKCSSLTLAALPCSQGHPQPPCLRMYSVCYRAVMTPAAHVNGRYICPACARLRQQRAHDAGLLGMRIAHAC